VASIDHANQLSDETMRIMRERGIFAVPTFAIVTYFAEQAANPRTAQRERQGIALHAAEFRKQLAAGVPMAMGSDVGPFPHGTQGREFVLMVQYGMSPLEALRAGTINAARLLGWEGQIGVLHAGRYRRPPESRLRHERRNGVQESGEINKAVSRQRSALSHYRGGSTLISDR
jgi:imidazolonepropionase-like amidohydrolase